MKMKLLKLIPICITISISIIMLRILLLLGEHKTIYLTESNIIIVSIEVILCIVSLFWLFVMFERGLYD